VPPFRCCRGQHVETGRRFGDNKGNRSVGVTGDAFEAANLAGHVDRRGIDRPADCPLTVGEIERERTAGDLVAGEFNSKTSAFGPIQRRCSAPQRDICRNHVPASLREGSVSRHCRPRLPAVS
jgi:hypothetical protein